MKRKPAEPTLVIPPPGNPNVPGDPAADAVDAAELEEDEPRHTLSSADLVADDVTFAAARDTALEELRQRSLFITGTDLTDADERTVFDDAVGSALEAARAAQWDSFRTGSTDSLTEVLPHLAQALARAEGLGDHPDRAMLRATLGSLNARAGNLEAARLAFDGLSDEDWASIASPTDRATARQLYAVALEEAGDRAGAVQQLTLAIDEFAGLENGEVYLAYAQLQRFSMVERGHDRLLPEAKTALGTLQNVASDPSTPGLAAAAQRDVATHGALVIDVERALGSSRAVA
ncbi:MAG: hypothetical protein ACOYNI_01815 [Acidimicrobiia bacterium]